MKHLPEKRIAIETVDSHKTIVLLCAMLEIFILRLDFNYIWA